jgi:hypothetical protein
VSATIFALAAPGFGVLGRAARQHASTNEVIARAG